LSTATEGFLRFFATFSGQRASFERRQPVKRAVRLLSTGSVVLAGLASLQCGTSGHAILLINAPSTVVAGVPFTATVTAMYDGRVDTVIDGPIHFTSSDPAAVLPTLYVFTAADAGSHTFNNLVLNTAGNQTMTVSDYDATPIAGTANLVVTAPLSDGQSEAERQPE
jgi:hypothetical protein